MILFAHHRVLLLLDYLWIVILLSTFGWVGIDAIMILFLFFSRPNLSQLCPFLSHIYFTNVWTNYWFFLNHTRTRRVWVFLLHFFETVLSLLSTIISSSLTQTFSLYQFINFFTDFLFLFVFLFLCFLMYDRIWTIHMLYCYIFLPIDWKTFLSPIYIHRICWYCSKLILRIQICIGYYNFFIVHSWTNNPSFWSNEPFILQFLGKGSKLLKKCRFKLNIFFTRIQKFQSFEQTPFKSNYIGMYLTIK